MRQNHPLSILSVCTLVLGSDLVEISICLKLPPLIQECIIPMSWIQCHAENGACGMIFLSIYFQILQLCVSYQRKQEVVKHTPIKFDKQLM